LLSSSDFGNWGVCCVELKIKRRNIFLAFYGFPSNLVGPELHDGGWTLITALLGKKEMSVNGAKAETACQQNDG
jgi:hypothetical protein